jgi:anti-sigma factor RsiW
MAEDKRQRRRWTRNRREPAWAARALVLVAIVVGGLGSHGVSVDLDVTLTSNDSHIGVIRTCKLEEAIRAARGATRPGRER